MAIPNPHEAYKEKFEAPEFDRWIAGLSEITEDIYEKVVGYLKPMKFEARLAMAEEARKRGDAVGEKVYRISQAYARAELYNEQVVERKFFADDIGRMRPAGRSA